MGLVKGEGFAVDAKDFACSVKTLMKSYIEAPLRCCDRKTLNASGSPTRSGIKTNFFIGGVLVNFITRSQK